MASSRKGQMILFDIPFHSNNLKSLFLLGFVFIHLFAHGQVLDSAVAKTDSNQTVTVIGVGDMMLGTNFPSSSYLPPNQGKNVLSGVDSILRQADVTFGNLEGVILSGAGKVKNCKDPKYCYAFKMPDSYVNHFVYAGFDVLSLANNHSNDFGTPGIRNTQRILQESGIAFAGLTECPTATFERDGLTYGFMAFSPNRGTIRINNYEFAREQIAKLDSTCDIVIVSFHGGAEGSTHTHLTKSTEIYLGENRGNPHEFARMAIDAGADVIFGHGPHVTRAMDLYKGRFIAYSLGNFATYARFNLSGPNGLCPMVELNLAKDGRFESGKIHSCKQPGEGGPRIDPENEVLREIISLNQTDLPESTLQIGDDGTLTSRK